MTGPRSAVRIASRVVPSMVVSLPGARGPPIPPRSRRAGGRAIARGRAKSDMRCRGAVGAGRRRAHHEAMDEGPGAFAGDLSPPGRLAGPGEGISPEELALAARNHGLPLEALRHDLTPLGLHYVLVHYDIPYVPDASSA